MTKWMGVLLGACALCLTVTASARASSILFDNGTGGNPCTNTADACIANAWNISDSFNDFAASDTFTLSSDATLTEIELWAWLMPGDTLNTVDWSIGPSAFSSLYGGTATPSATFVQTDGRDMYDIYDVTFPLSVPLSAGDYWLTLTHAAATGGPLGPTYGHPVFWDQNDGPSTAQQNSISLADCNFGQSTTCSDSFRILGAGADGAQVPEPTSMVLLGTGLLAAGMRRRRNS